MLSLENVERIEILKGPASVLYGSDAIGGVVNIITKEPLKPTFSYSLRYLHFENGGNPETKSVSFSAYTGRWHNLNLGVYGKYTKADAYEQIKGYWELTPDREIRGGGLTLFYYLDKTGKNKLRLDYEKQEYDHLQIYPVMGRPRKHYDFNEKHNYSLSFEGQVKGFGLKLRGYYTEFKMEVPRRALNGTLEDYDYGKRDMRVIEGSLTRTLLGGHRLTIGGEWRESDIEGTRLETKDFRGFKEYEGRKTPVYRDKIKYYAGYIQDEWFLGDRAFIVIGLRYDDSDKLDSALTPRLGATYSLRPDMRIKGNYAKGFRNPTVEQLYYRVRVPAHWIWGNPELKSEKSDGFDFAFEKDFGRKGGIKVGFFYQKAEDLIITKRICRGDARGTCRTRTGEVVPVRVPYHEYVNLDKAKFQGLELSVAYNFSEKISSRLAYTYLEAKDETNDIRLDQRARHRGIGEISINPLKNLGVSLVLEYTGDYLFANENKNYLLGHLNLTYKVFKAVEIFGGVENLGDKKDVDLPLLGRAYFIGVRGRF